MASHTPPATGRESSRDKPSAIVKRSIVVAGHKTSVSLEDAFWHSLREIAHNRDMSLQDVVGYIDGHRHNGNLSSTIRLFVLEYARAERQAIASGVEARPAMPTLSTIA
jgi:predicted DNA-binding ribbon-helix-helix protein